MFRRTRPVSFVNGRVVALDGAASSLRFSDRVLGLDDLPQPGDEVLDLDGAFVLPGLINAHDHLELNHYGRLSRRDRYENATSWIDDLRPALREDANIRRNTSYPLRDRLFIGGLKNLLAGATTVAHHNPIYREMSRRFPVRIVKDFGWAHSFQLENQPVGAHGELGGSVRQRCLDTPEGFPFIVHMAEGVDSTAADEVRQLEAIGCLRSNTVIVHGVALTDAWWARVLAMKASLVWCPASNEFLFGQTIPVREYLDASPEAWRHLCLGTDSRVTGSRDLLEEMRAAAAAAGVSPQELLRMATTAAAQVLRLEDGAGGIAIGSPADVLVVPAVADDAATALLALGRADIQCVTIAGRPMVADRRFCAAFKARGVDARPLVVDGTDRLAESALARDIARCSIQEPGVTSFA